MKLATMRPIFSAALALLSCVAFAADDIPLYIGTGADGIYLTMFDTETGDCSVPVKVAQTQRPTFLWIHSPTESLYSISELGRGKNGQGAAIVSWAIDDRTGMLSERNRQDAQSDGPCFVSVSADGKVAAIANYGGGSVALFPIHADGSLGPASSHVVHRGSSINARRQSEPHAHSSRFDPSDQRVAVADLGTDKVYLYDVDCEGAMSPSDPPAIETPAGSGPRHFVFSPDDEYMLILGELSGTITTVRYLPPNISTVETISTMAAGTPDDAPRGSAEILFHPNGRFVYCSNRGPSEIACFDYDATTGRLKRTSAISSGGVHPRNFRISPDGRFVLVANQNSDNVVVFEIDPQSGRLRKTNTELTVPKPMCLKFLAK